jgi:hypothetical protein
LILFASHPFSISNQPFATLFPFIPKELSVALDLFQTDTYRSLIRDHLYNTLAFLLEEGQEFAVAAEVEHTHIDPELPRHILKSFGETALFVLSGYTFESAWIDETHLFFEAGFGKENIDAHVSIPFLALKQVFVGEYPIAINIASPFLYETEEKAAPNHSMDALMRNPENQKLFHTTKK